MSHDLHIPIIEEEAYLHKRAVETERVRVRTFMDEEETVVTDELRRQQVEVTRVAIDREVTAAPEIRTEGDVTIVPVLEERLVVEKRLFLVEELHFRRTAVVDRVTVPVTLRRTRIDIERTNIDQQEEDDART